MSVNDEDNVAERLAQAHAERRHLTRLRAAERRDAVHEREADEAAEREAHAPPDLERTAPSHPADEWRRTLVAEQAALELDRDSLGADREIDSGSEREC